MIKETESKADETKTSKKYVHFTQYEQSVIINEIDPATFNSSVARSILHKLPGRTVNQITHYVQNLNKQIRNKTLIVECINQSQKILINNSPMKSKHFEAEEKALIKTAYDPVTFEINEEQLDIVSAQLGRNSFQVRSYINRLRMSQAVEQRTQQSIAQKMAQIQAQQNILQMNQHITKKPFTLPQINYIQSHLSSNEGSTTKENEPVMNNVSETSIVPQQSPSNENSTTNDTEPLISIVSTPSSSIEDSTIQTNEEKDCNQQFIFNDFPDLPTTTNDFNPDGISSPFNGFQSPILNIWDYM